MQRKINPFFKPTLTLALYTLLVGIYVNQTHGTLGEFFGGLGLILTARFGFFILDSIGEILDWKLYSKAIQIDNFFSTMRECEFPGRVMAHHDVTCHLQLVIDNPDNHPDTRIAAMSIRTLLMNTSDFLSWWRLTTAAEDALERYSPRIQAPKILVYNEKGEPLD
jgi:hypothetical protein